MFGLQGDLMVIVERDNEETDIYQYEEDLFICCVEEMLISALSTTEMELAIRKAVTKKADANISSSMVSVRQKMEVFR